MNIKTTCVDPDAVDRNALMLMESGVMNADDFASMAERFRKNATMLRLVAFHAHKRMDKASYMRDSAERSKLERVINHCNDVLDSFNQPTAKRSGMG